MPQFAADYYGPNEALRRAWPPTKTPGAWFTAKPSATTGV